ncbi:unnamed protein product [Penicillium bialowiezense]
MESTFESRHGARSHSQAHNSGIEPSVERAPSNARIRASASAGSVPHITTRDVDGIARREASRRRSSENQPLIHHQFGPILRKIYKLRIPCALGSVTVTDMRDLEIRRSYRGQVEDFARACAELSGLEDEIRTRIVMLRPHVRRQFMRLYGEQVDEAIGFP